MFRLPSLYRASFFSPQGISCMSLDCTLEVSAWTLNKSHYPHSLARSARAILVAGRPRLRVASPPGTMCVMARQQSAHGLDRVSQFWDSRRMGNAADRKPVRFMGSSREDLRAFPKEVRVVMGVALNTAQLGGT